MGNKVYIVMHSMGMDGDYTVAAFSKKEDADKLCSLYNSTDDYGDYDFYYTSEIEIDKNNIEDYYIHTDEDEEEKDDDGEYYRYNSLRHKGDKYND